VIPGTALSNLDAGLLETLFTLKTGRFRNFLSCGVLFALNHGWKSLRTVLKQYTRVYPKVDGVSNDYETAKAG
jgi:hypothetical protein